MTVKDMIQEMINELTEILDDAKYDSEWSSWNSCEESYAPCKNLAQDVRIKVQEDKNAR